MPRLIPCVVVAAAMALAACQKPASDAQAPAPAATPAAPAAPAAPAPAQPVPAPAPAPSDMPELKVATVDGAQYDLAQHRGKWVVVNFWATWCKPCLKEMPELSALDAMREHIEVVGLAYEEIEPADMRAFLQKHPVSYPVAIVDTYNPPASFETPRGLPMTYLIGPDGKVAEKFLGPITAENIEAAIAKAGGPKPTTGAAAGES